MPVALADHYRHIRIAGSAEARTLTLSRPDVRNAFNAELIAEVTQVLRTLADDTRLRVLILAADGPTFCAGADFNWMSGQKALGLDANLDDARRLFDMFYALYGLPCPTIARVQGGAFGGGAGLVACCDLVVMADDAQIAYSEVRIGLVPATISPFVIRKIGEGRARELFLTGMQISARRAVEVGLANVVVPTTELDAKVAEYVSGLERCGPQALRVTKQLLRNVAALPVFEARDFTARMIAEQRVSPEGQEGMAAFLEKRKPDWTK